MAGANEQADFQKRLRIEIDELHVPLLQICSNQSGAHSRGKVGPSEIEIYDFANLKSETLGVVDDKKPPETDIAYVEFVLLVQYARKQPHRADVRVQNAHIFTAIEMILIHQFVNRRAAGDGIARVVVIEAD